MFNSTSLYVRYTVIVGLTACALVASLALKPIFEPNYFLPFLAVVLAGSWFYGRTAGISATVLSTAAAAYFFTQPYGWTELARLVTFVLSAAAITLLATAVRNMRIRLEGTLSSIGDAVVVIDRGGCITFLNPVAEGMTGWKVEEARKKALGTVLKLADEKTGEPMDPPTKEILAEGTTFQASRHKVLISRDGHKAWVEESVGPIRDEKGRVSGAVLVFRDITARREAQDQVSQSQKMEAVGRLAGGVAGDFNNLLTVITGYSEMLRAELPNGNPMRRFADEIYLAAERAAGLTRQLLSLGRGPAGQMKVLDLNALFGSMETMLKRLLGNRIELVLVPAPGPGKVKADASQMEQVLMNLAMNSRDAMPQGGKLVIEIANIELGDRRGEERPGIGPGSYVMVAVSDTGCGMDAETRTRLFEPFFTTKTKSKGSGLGLSIVYGIVQQSGGHINVYSQLGAGTIFEIYLPRERGTVDTLVPVISRSKRRGTETVLIADDEDGVRKLVHAVLATNGYTVLEARDGKEALAMYEANRAQVELVVTDIVMPQMTGLELGERLGGIDPDLRVLYISGFRDTPIGNAGDNQERIFLHKPFTPDVLLARVRELLDGPVPPAAGGVKA